jgi:flagellar motor switch protein FliN/FliY
MLTEEEIRSFLTGGNSGEANIRKVQFPSLEPFKGMGRVKTALSHLDDVNIDISVELGKAILKIRDVLALIEGSVIKLDKAVGDTVEMNMNQQRFARGEVIIINDSFGVRISTINRAQNLNLTEGLV